MYCNRGVHARFGAIFSNARQAKGIILLQTGVGNGVCCFRYPEGINGTANDLLDTLAR